MGMKICAECKRKYGSWKNNPISMCRDCGAEFCPQCDGTMEDRKHDRCPYCHSRNLGIKPDRSGSY